MNLAIGIQSCKNNADRRNSIRNTWLRDVPNDLRVSFFVGEEDCQDDVVSLKCKDSYEDCWIKQFEMIKCLKDYDYVFFCDDDTYVVVDRLLNSGYQNHDYVGCPCYVSEGNIMMAHGGAGFWMSKKAMNAAIEVGLDHPSFRKNIFSDRTVAYLMDIAGVKLHGDCRYNLGKYMNNRGFCNILPNSSNKYITTHFVNSHISKMIYDHFRNGSKLPANNYSINVGVQVVIFENESGIWSYVSSEKSSFASGFPMANDAELAAIKRFTIR